MNRPEPAQLSDPHKGELCSVRRLEKAVISQLVPRRNLARVQPVLEVAFPASSVLLQTGCSALVVPSSSDVCGGGQLLGLFPRPFQANPKATSNIPILLSLGRVHLSQGTAVVPLPDVGRLCPHRPLGHPGVWSSACLEVWKAWLCLFAQWCGLSSSWQGTLRPAAAVGCVLVLGSEICPFPRVPDHGNAGQIKGSCSARCCLWEDV